MNNFIVNYDIRPYLPDIFINGNIYNSCDNINNNTNVPINTTIVIINLKDEQLNSIYNEPNYMLYGKKTSTNPYLYPSLYFLYSFDITKQYQ
jgi:hypothetical protein